MSYHRARRPRQALGMPLPTTSFVEAVSPYVGRGMATPNAIYSPYGWGPDFNIGMPMNYTHHIGYVREPVSRRFGTYYDRLGDAGDGLGSTLVVL